MPTITKTKTPSKCRAWEQERRKRLGTAFSDLAAALPTEDSPSAPNTKLIILQQSLRYIHQLQAATKHDKGSGVDVAVETDDLDEVKVLKTKCWELVKLLVQARIPLPTPPTIITITPAEKYTTISSADSKTTGSVHEILKEKDTASPDSSNVNEKESCCESSKQDEPSTSAEHEDGGSCGEDMEEEEEEEDTREKEMEESSNSSSNSDKCSKCRGARTAAAGKRKGNSSNEKKKKDGGKEGNNKMKEKRNTKKKATINRKHTRKKAKEVVVDNTGLGTMHNIGSASNVWVTNGSLRGPVVLPLIPSLLPPAPPTILINPFSFPLLTAPRKLVGFDITKTTMVNKVPIPTTTFSMGKKKGNGKTLKPLPKVSYQTRQKMLKIMKNDSKKKEDDKGTDANNKENQKEVKETKQDSKTKETPKKAAELNSVVDNKEVTSSTKGKANNKSNTSKKVDTQICDKPDSSNKPNSKTVPTNPSKESKTNSKQNIEEQTQIKVTVETRRSSDGNSNKKNETQKVFVVEPIQSVVPPPTSSESMCLTIPNDHNVHKYNSNNTNLGNNLLVVTNKLSEDSNANNNSCVKESGSKRRRVEENIVESERQEIGGDMGEELSLPSPTAAFLLTFPLVCSGPSEPLQPSQDQYSNYFPRESTVSTSTQTNTFLPNDCPTIKPYNPIVDVTKTTWTLTPNTSTYSKSSGEPRILAMPDRNISSMKEAPTSSACVFSGSQNIFSSVSVCNNNYPFSESIFNYEHAPVGGNIKGIGKASYPQNNKVPFNFDNLHSDHKQQTNDGSLYSSIPNSIVNNDTNSTFLYNNSDKDNNKISSSMACTNNTKKNYDNSNSCKLFFTSSSSVVNKSDTLPSSVQSKPVFSNASSIYTSTNSYNPFDLPITPTTFSVSNTIPNNNLRSKTSNMYYPEFTPNVYTQSCNLWMEDTNSFAGEFTKTDPKKSSNSMNPSQNYPSSIVMDTQPDFRYPTSSSSKNSNVHVSNNKNAVSSQTNKNVKVGPKISVKDTKYLVQETKDNKTEFSTQKGLVNWMTSEVSFGQNNQDIFSNNNNQKDLRNNMLQGSNQCGIDSSLPLAGLPSTVCNKKSELYDQPFYMPSGGFVPQTLNDDNQFTWSPSKLMPLAESAPLVPCSLPTLVGDLSLSMGDTKQTYQHLFLEQPDNNNVIIKSNDKKSNQQKNKTPVKTNSNNNKGQCEMNASNAGSFLSVSQIMERGKEDNVYQDTSNTNKGNVHYNQNRNMNINLSNINKPSEMPVFPTEVFGVQQMTDYFPPPVHKATQKNTYSTESLLQSNDNQYNINSNSNTKSNKNVNKSYEASNLCISSNVNNNQQSNGNNQMEFENFSHTNFSNSYHSYPGTVYTTSNYLPASAPTASSYSCINSGYMPDTNDYSANMDNSFYTKMDTCPSLDVPKYNFDISNNKNTNNNNNATNKVQKSENLKKEAVLKRQRKSKGVINESYVAQRCYPVVPTGDETAYGGYQMSMGSQYQSSTAAPTHKVRESPVKLGATSPNHSGTSSLANFNLSTIFPEINKRPAMPGYSDSSHKPSMSLYL